jgi:hypothetical protein
MVETEFQDRPEDLLAHAASLRSRTQAQVQGAWFPLLVFGFVTLVTIPLYVRPFDYPHGDGGWGGVIGTRVPFFAGLPGARSQNQAWLFWLLAAPLSYLVCALWYHRRARRVGLSPRWRRYVGLGLGFFLVVAALHLEPGRTLVASTGRVHLLPGDDFGVGIAAVLSPLIAVALGLLILAWVERNWLVAVIAAVYCALVLLINTYGFGNLPAWISGHPSVRTYFVAPAHNVVVLAAVLLLGAASTGISAWRARRSS